MFGIVEGECQTQVLVGTGTGLRGRQPDHVTVGLLKGRLD